MNDCLSYISNITKHTDIELHIKAGNHFGITSTQKQCFVIQILKHEDYFSHYSFKYKKRWFLRVVTETFFCKISLGLKLVNDKNSKLAFNIKAVFTKPAPQMYYDAKSFLEKVISPLRLFHLTYTANNIDVGFYSYWGLIFKNISRMKIYHDAVLTGQPMIPFLASIQTSPNSRDFIELIIRKITTNTAEESASSVDIPINMVSILNFYAIFFKM